MGLEIVAGTPRGGGQDRTARALASVLEEKTTISNVSGRGGGNAWDLLARRVGSPDLAGVSSPTMITNVIMGEAHLDHRGLTPLAMLYTEYSALVVRSGSTLEEPSALLETLAGGMARVAFATALGNMNHLSLAEIAAHLAAPVTTMPIRVFESAPQALADVVAGSADIGIVSAVSAIPGIGAGVLTPVLVTAPDRIGGGLEEVPTCLELAVPCVRGTWRGLVGPPGIDASSIRAWSDRLSAAVTTERWRHILDDNLWVDNYLGPDDVGRFLEAERVELGVLLEQVGLATTVGNG